MSHRSFLAVVHEERIIQKDLHDISHALLPSTLLQAANLPLEQCANDALAILVQLAVAGGEPRECGDTARRPKQLARRDVRDAVHERAELLQSRGALEEEGRRRRACGLGEGM